MKVRRYSSRFVMHASLSSIIWVAASLGSMTVLAAEAVPGGSQMQGIEGAPLPLPTEAETPYQDQKGFPRHDVRLDEAIFTEISPLTTPEVAIALPEDQDH